MFRIGLPIATLSALLVLAALPFWVLAEERRQFPFFDVDGWECHGRGCKPLRALHGAIVGEDADATHWFFSAPAPVVRALACANALAFRISHPEFDSRGVNPLSDFDIVVVSHALNMSLGLASIVSPWAIMTEASVSLDGSLQGGERGKDVWVRLDHRGGPMPDGVPTTPREVRSVMEQASALLIRGSFYAGAEVTCIERLQVTLMEGCVSSHSKRVYTHTYRCLCIHI